MGEVGGWGFLNCSGTRRKRPDLCFLFTRNDSGPATRSDVGGRVHGSQRS